MRTIKPILVILLLMLHYALWIGDKNVFDYYHLTESANVLKLQNQELKQHNNKLLAEVVDLKSGGVTVETLARSDLGLIKKGETFFQVVE